MSTSIITVNQNWVEGVVRKLRMGLELWAMGSSIFSKTFMLCVTRLEAGLKEECRQTGRFIGIYLHVDFV